MSRVTFAMLATIASLLCSSTVFAQSGETSRHEVLNTNDGYAIHITYYPYVETQDSDGGGAKNAPVVVMVPGDNESRLTWDKSSSPRDKDSFPVVLQKRGYAVITVDPRKHGESSLQEGEKLTPNDYAGIAALDLLAVKAFLYKEHQAERLNMRKLGIIGSGTGGTAATVFTEFDWSLAPHDDAPSLAERTPRGQDVKVLILLSPEASAGRLKATNAMRSLRNPVYAIAVQIIVGGDDQNDKKMAESIFQAYSPSKTKEANPRAVLLTPPVKDKGIALLRQPAQYVQAFKFLEDNLKPLPIMWQDRRSRLEL
ncbi:hypothetical protein SH668x_001122 [Planctomicrobium sp. SH668]|uniref:hypothetical protein n=1 Tax=Planctomicrobium sp. SH668 TaxID=3448126 RepID=UPI003F5C76FA